MAMATIKDRQPTKRMAYLPKLRAIRHIRAEHNIKLREIADAVHRDIAHVCDVLNGSKNSPVVATEIAEFFGVPVEKLFRVVDLEAMEREENPDRASAA
jgi:transcriptional regulator with XRE-family HTH domain